MVAMVADIPGIEQPAVGGLILKIECPVLRVRQFVVDVVAAKQERPKQIAGWPTSGITARGLLEVRQQRQETGGAIGRGRRWRGAERAAKVAPCAAEIGCTNGGASVTPNGPLKPEPALGER